MNFDLPPDLVSYIDSLDKFINSTILPLQHTNDNDRFFDHRREFARTDWAKGGIPIQEWEELLGINDSMNSSAICHISNLSGSRPGTPTR